MAKEIETVSLDLIRDIRNHIGREEKQAELLKSLCKWLRLTSALDTLEDTSGAVQYYLDTEYPTSKNGAYLFTYGLLQALFVQMDAAKSISESLLETEVNFKAQYPMAYAVREMRDDVTGHPTVRRTRFHIYLAQCSLSKYSFYYIKENDETGDYKSIDVDISAAIKETSKCINSILGEALDNLETEFKAYIEKHRERKMTKIFENLIYPKEKVMLDPAMADWGYNATKNMVKKCEDELVLRYGAVDVMDSYKSLLDNIHETYTLIDQAIPLVSQEYQDNMKKHLLQGLFRDLEELKGYCEETDRYFENYGEEEHNCKTESTKVIIVDDLGK